MKKEIFAALLLLLLLILSIFCMRHLSLLTKELTAMTAEAAAHARAGRDSEAGEIMEAAQEKFCENMRLSSLYLSNEELRETEEMFLELRQALAAGEDGLEYKFSQLIVRLRTEAELQRLSLGSIFMHYPYLTGAWTAHP